MAAADSLKFPFLEHSQQGILSLGRQLANFVKENGTALGQLKATEASLLRSSEGSFLMTKQFRGNQRRRDSSTANGNERPSRSVRALVDGTRDEFLSSARLARDENGGIRRSNPGDTRKHGLQSRR